MNNYPFKEIEPKWRKFWESTAANKVDLDDAEKKMYVLVMFSYPSEKKLHIGHWWNYGATDTYSRFKRMQGYRVFEPMGFDAFGLPAENYAVKHNVHPATTTKNSVKSIKKQLDQIGTMYDWSREVDTSTPEYYKWTQWLFLQLFKTGSAYRKMAPVNWCPKCLTVLANEQVLDNGSCERCDTTVINRDLEQWFFRITDFADQLIDDLDAIDWPESTKIVQRNWIGRSEGTEIVFKTEDESKQIKTFTTRADTVYGVTYIVLAPEHPLVSELTAAERKDEIQDYVMKTRNKSDIERLTAERDKTGIFTGSYAVNPVNNEKIPVWIADYVLGSYGTGAVMAVPAHDQRDYEFAKEYGLPVRSVIKPPDSSTEVPGDRAFEDYGVMFNSCQFDELSSENGIIAVSKWLEEIGAGGTAKSYRLRDWSVSRQRYWGAPIPIIYCPDCGIVPVPEEDLPVLLPEDIEDFTPRGTSPLGSLDSFMDVKCPKCGEDARRDPDTIDTFVDSSWYFLRYTSTEFHDRPFDAERIKNWLPVDVYIGGPEHRTGHLVYTRYIIKYLYSQGLLHFNEPAKKLIHQGIISCQGQRMSKSKGNVVNPDEFVSKYGSDCFRLYLMFMGDFRIGGDWTDEGIVGIRRFQNRVWRLVDNWSDKLVDISESASRIDSELNRILHHTIKEVTNDLDNFQFNTAISRLMELVNALYQYTADKARLDRAFLKEVLRKLVLTLAPFAPHFAEELWERLGYKGSVFDQEWCKWEKGALEQSTVNIAVQINGRLICSFEVSKGSGEAEVADLAMKNEKVRRHVKNKAIRRRVFVRDRILNLVV